jgi:hypothetical protein
VRAQILKRINAVISARIAAGENLPPPPRTAIAGPEYFGLNDAATQVCFLFVLLCACVCVGVRGAACGCVRRVLVGVATPSPW